MVRPILQPSRCCLCCVSALVAAGVNEGVRASTFATRKQEGECMSIVPVYRYASDEEYKTKNSIGGSYVSATCSMADIVRYSLDNGDFEGHVVTSLWGQMFYRSIPLFALTSDMTSRRFLATDDYRHAEASYKGAVSFYLGMIGARLVFEKFLGGNKRNYQLLHAGDSKYFSLTTSNGKRKPDYVAINDRGVPYALVEAKGTSGVRVHWKRVKDAKDQLNLASVTTLNGAGRPLYVTPGAELQKHVVASSFTYGVASKASSWQLCDVDPQGLGEGELTIQLDEAIYAHYVPVMQRLSGDGVRRENVSGVDCDLIQIGEGVSAGLVSGLREVIADGGRVGAGSGDQHGDVRERDSADFFHRVSEFFHSMEGFRGLSEGENVSIGGDGVVVVLSDEYVRAFNLESD